MIHAVLYHRVLRCASHSLVRIRGVLPSDWLGVGGLAVHPGDPFSSVCFVKHMFFLGRPVFTGLTGWLVFVKILAVKFFPFAEPLPLPPLHPLPFLLVLD